MVTRVRRLSRGRVHNFESSSTNRFPLQSHDCTLLLASSHVRVQRVVKLIERELARHNERHSALKYARSLDAALKTHIRDAIAAATTLWYGGQDGRPGDYERRIRRERRLGFRCIPILTLRSPRDTARYARG